MQAILVELLLTLTFVTVFIHTSMEKKNLQSTSPALCGLTLAAGILAGYTVQITMIVSSACSVITADTD